LDLVEREWRDLHSEAAADPVVDERYTAAVAKVAARQNEVREQEVRVRRDNLKRLQSLALRVEQLAARADLTLKAGGRALPAPRPARTAGRHPTDAVAAGSRRHPAAVEGGADRADAEGAGAARGHRMAAVGQCRRPGAAVRPDGGAPLDRRARESRFAGTSAP